MKNQCVIWSLENILEVIKYLETHECQFLKYEYKLNIKDIHNIQNLNIWAPLVAARFYAAVFALFYSHHLNLKFLWGFPAALLTLHTFTKLLMLRMYITSFLLKVFLNSINIFSERKKLPVCNIGEPWLSACGYLAEAKATKAAATACLQIFWTLNIRT